MEHDGLGDEGGLDGPRVKKVRVVAHFTELHQDVNDGHKMTAGQRLPSPEDQREETGLATIQETLKKKGVKM